MVHIHLNQIQPCWTWRQYGLLQHQNKPTLPHSIKIPQKTIIWILDTANRCYFSLQKHFKSNFISVMMKILLYKTSVCPIILYGVDCWTLSQTKDRMVQAFKRKLLQRIYGPVKDRYHWKCRFNKELYNLF
jgi:hypothetical protein